jgi:hypothetical protein
MDDDDSKTYTTYLRIHEIPKDVHLYTNVKIYVIENILTQKQQYEAT